MDKSWMEKDRVGDEYKEGFKQFLNFAFENVHPLVETIRCPCKKCNNSKLKTRSEVHSNLLWKGIAPGYIDWIYHGEGLTRMQANGTATRLMT
ncbi:hypothetical protein MKW92_040244 [Papaver armeniacum]|nr:hypothetical protein MKW92_040244 [Papaver armeniacum]